MRDLRAVIESLNELISSDVTKGCLDFADFLGVDCDDYENDEHDSACSKCRKAQARAVLAAIEQAREAGRREALAPEDTQERINEDVKKFPSVYWDDVHWLLERQRELDARAQHE